MPSGRKGRGSRHRKQKLEELLDYDEDSNLSHGPDPTPSPWAMEPLPPHVEGPPVLKQDGESVESLPRGINRNEESLKALRVQLPPPSKRKKGATNRTASDTDVANSATATSLDRWDGGDLQVDETLPYFYPSRGELEVASYELKNSNDKVEVLANGTGSKDSKSDGNMKAREWKSRPEVAAGNRSRTVIDVFGIRQQVEASPSNSNMHTKHNATHQKGLSELVECNETTSSVDMNAVKGPKLGSSALEHVESNFLIGGSSKRVEKESGAAGQLSHTCETDAFKDKPEWKRGKASDLGLSSSLKLHISRPKRSEGSQMSRRFGDLVQIVSRDDAEVLEKPQHAAEKGTDWALQEDNRNPELEKELENRIRRRREESREESGEKEKWREYEKEKSIRRHHHQKEEWYKEESRHREEKNQEEKPKEDGGKAEKGRIDSRQKDKKYKENRYMESKLKEEKQKTDRNRQLPCRDDKECKENRKVDRDKEQRSIDGRLRGDRHKVEKEKDNRQKEDRDAKQQEDSFRDGRFRVDKDKEQKIKVEKVRDYRNKEERLSRDDHFECHKEENSWNNVRFQDEKEKQVRPRDKVDRAKARDKEERLETIKEGKVRDERGKNPIKEDLKDEKGSHGKKKGEGEQEDISRTDKLQDKRQKIEKQQDGRDKNEREKVASRRRDDREAESRQREAISKEEKLQDYKDGDERQGGDHRQRSKGEKVAMDRLVDFRQKADRENGDGERPVDVNGSGDKEAKQAEVHGKSREVLDGRKADDKQGDAWWTKQIGHFDMERDFCLSQDELGIQSKDLPDQLQVRKAREREARGDRKVVEKLTVQEGDQRVTKDDIQDRERAFSMVASSGAMVAHKSERRLKRNRDVDTVDSAITEKSHERSRGKRAEVENDLPLDDYKVLHCNHEDRLSPYDAPPRSPSPSLQDGNLPPSSEKPARRSKFETSISASSSSGTQWARERIRHMIEQTDQIKQHHDLEEVVKSWDPRGTNQDSDDGRGWSLSPNKNWDAFSSLPPDSGKEEYRRGLVRGQEDGYVSEREHHRFSQSGGPSKTRRVDGGPWERKEWRLQGSQMKRAPMGGPMVRPQVQARLLPPPPPFRPGIDNPAVIGARGSNFDEGPGSKESERYDRKLSGAFKRSDMGGPGEMWKGVGVGVSMGMGMGIENWNVQNPGLGPGNMFSPFAHIGGHPSAGFLGMAQHFPVPPLYGSGSAMPSSDMGFGVSTRYHAGVRFPHGPYHGPVMGWQRPAEPNEDRLPLADTWEGHGHYIDERHRFGYFEWDEGGKGMTSGDPWQGQAGDASTGLNPPCFQREASCQGNIPGKASAFYKDNDQKIEDPLQEIPDTTDPQTASPADPADDMLREALQVESKATVQSKARLIRILLNLDVSAKLASNDLYKQYLSLLPASEVKIREMLVLKQSDASHGPIEEDLEFEVDSEAQELLSTPGLYADLLPQLSNNVFEEAIAIYHRPIQDTSIQKSVFGSFILPIDASLINMPSLGADLGTVRVGQLEVFGDQSCSSHGFDGPLSARKESLIRASRLQDGTERVQDNQGSSLMRDEFSMGQGVALHPRSKQEGVAEVSVRQGGYGGTLGDEDIARNVDMVAYQMPSSGVVNCNIGLDIPVAEANVELSAIAEMQAREDGNARQMEVVRLDCKGGEWPTGRDDSILVEHCSEAFKEGWRKQHSEAAKKKEDRVASASQSSVSNATAEWQIELEPKFKIDEVKINSRPQQSSEIAYENTH